MTSARTDLCPWGVWRKSDDFQVIYDSDVEDERLRLEDELREDEDLSLDLRSHTIRNEKQLKALLPEESELQALSIVNQGSMRLGSRAENNRGDVFRLRNAVRHYGSLSGNLSHAFGTRLDEESAAYFLISKPSASKMKSGCLNPSTYRPDRVGALDLEGLAEALGILEWSEKTAFVDKALEMHSGRLLVEDVADAHYYNHIIRRFSAFLNIDDMADERAVESSFAALLSAIGDSKEVAVDVGFSGARRFAVGGMLALPNFAVQGRTDSTYVLSGRCAIDSQAESGGEYTFLTSEFKTDVTFPPANLWYRGTRGVQCLAALWSCYEVNRRCPTILLSQSKFKLLLFIEEKSTRELHLYQFPGGYESGDTRTPQFLKMIVLLLLSAFQFSKPRISSPPRLLGESLVSLREQPSAEKSNLHSSYKRMVDRKSDSTAEDGGASGNEHGNRLPLGELFLSDPSRRRMRERLRSSSRGVSDKGENALFDWRERVWAADPNDLENLESLEPETH
jgi:hypothetical protein